MSLSDLENNSEVVLDYIDAIGYLFPDLALSGDDVISDDWICKGLKQLSEWCYSNGLGGCGFMSAVDDHDCLAVDEESVEPLVESGVLPYGLDLTLYACAPHCLEDFISALPEAYPLVCLTTRGDLLENVTVGEWFESIEDAVAAMNPATLLALTLRETPGNDSGDVWGSSLDEIVASPLRHLAALYIECGISYPKNFPSYGGYSGYNHGINICAGFFFWEVLIHECDNSGCDAMEILNITWANMDMLHQMVEDAEVIQNTCPPLELCNDESWLFEQVALARVGFALNTD